jgi:hypothetical protein
MFDLHAYTVELVHVVGNEYAVNVYRGEELVGTEVDFREARTWAEKREVAAEELRRYLELDADELPAEELRPRAKSTVYREHDAFVVTL